MLPRSKTTGCADSTRRDPRLPRCGRHNLDVRCSSLDIARIRPGDDLTDRTYGRTAVTDDAPDAIGVALEIAAKRWGRRLPPVDRSTSHDQCCCVAYQH
jgi:hypothetical protein